MAQPALPERASAVVIGGGVIGASTAYHLAKLGWSDVLLLERERFAGGTTWHAAGLIGTVRPHESLAKLLVYARDLLTEIEEETGQSTGFRAVGSLAIAHSRDRFEELKRLAAMNNGFGLTKVHLVTADEIASLYPLINKDGLIGGTWVPTDGRASPVDVVAAFIRGARGRGARCLEGVTVTAVHHENGRVTGVGTNAGRRQGRLRGQLRGALGAGRRADGGGRRAPLRLRALLRPHREDPGPPLRPPDPARLRHRGLHPGGRGEPPRRGLRAGRPPDRRLRASRRLLLRRAAGPRRGAAHAGPRGRHAPDPDPRRDRLAELLLRPRELHPRRPVPHRGGTRAARLLRRVRPQLGRDPVRGRGRQGGRGVDGAGARPPRPRGQRRPADGPGPEHPALPAGAGERDPRAPLRAPLPVPAVRDGAERAPLAAPRAPRRARGVLRGDGRLGTPQLVRAARGRAGLRVLLRPPELVRALGGRAPRGARGRRPLRPVELHQVPRGRPRRDRGPPARVHRQRGRRAGAHRLHPLAERTGWHRGGPHRHPPRRAPLLGGDGGGERGPRPRLAPPPRAPGGRLRGRGHHRRVGDPRGDGAGQPEPPRGADRRGPLRRELPVRRLPGGGDRLHPRAGDPRLLRRRAGVGALRARNGGPPRLRRADGRRGKGRTRRRGRR